MKFFVFCCILQAISIRIAFAIVGGSQAEPGQYPYQVSLQMGGSHRCGASILDSRTILTAGHCVNGMTPEFLSIKAQDQETYSISYFIFADKYNALTRTDDLVKIRLSSPISFNGMVGPVVLEPHDPTPGCKFQVLSDFPLRVYDVDITTMTTCQSKWGLLGNVDDTKICVGQDRDGSFDGRILVANKKVVGFNNFVDVPSFPSVYTRTSAYLSWINQKC